MAFLVTGAELNNYPDIREAMYRARHKIFHEELGWEVNSVNGLEFDEFDRDDTVYIIYQDHGHVIGTYRLLPTTSPYMLSHVFPELAEGHVPCADNIWEMSRYTVDKRWVKSREHFEYVQADIFATMCEFSLLNGIDEYVVVQHPDVTLANGLGLGIPHIKRKPRQFGKDMAQVCHYRPAYQQQLRQVCEWKSLSRPVTRSYTLSQPQTFTAVAAE